MPVVTTAKALIRAKYADDSVTAEYTVPSDTRTIIDKFTVVNTDASARTITIYFTPSNQSTNAEFTVCNAESISNSEHAVEIAELKGHVLESGDKIEVDAEVADKLVIYCSGREVVTS